MIQSDINTNSHGSGSCSVVECLLYTVKALSSVSSYHHYMMMAVVLVVVMKMMVIK